MIYLLQQYLMESARKWPDRIAVRSESISLTYRQLDTMTDQLAHFLVSLGVKRHDRVSFYLLRGTDAFVALFGILKADGIYVAVSPKIPVERLRSILDNCGCKYLVLDKTTYPVMEPFMSLARGIKFLVLSRRSEFSKMPPNAPNVYFLDNIEKQITRKHESSNIDMDLAYILYTSGSTGVSKGVMISHRNVIDYAEWASAYFKLGPEDIIANTSGLYFDLSVFDIYCGIMSGATIYVVPDAALLFPKDIINRIDRENVTVWNSVPSLMTYMAKMRVLDKGKCKNLRTVVFCGEVMPTQTIIEWMNAYPGRTFVNLYGPTETTCESMYYPVEAIPADATVPLPIGKACANTEVFALKEDLSLAGPGEEGELYIRGSSVGMGYWGDDAKTQASFICSPLNPFFREQIYATGDIVRLRSDGNYDFINRKDGQIKYMGYRIELGDIEAALSSVEGVIESAVIAVPDPTTQGVQIIAFVYLAQKISRQELQDGLKQKLPPYMIPKEILFLDAPLARNPNGKIDRQSFKERYLAQG